jgi:hypothetical protein
VVKAIVATIARNTGQLKRVDLPCGDGHATIGKACPVLLKNGFKWNLVS